MRAESARVLLVLGSLLALDLSGNIDRRSPPGKACTWRSGHFRTSLPFGSLGSVAIARPEEREMLAGWSKRRVLKASACWKLQLVPSVTAHRSPLLRGVYVVSQSEPSVTTLNGYRRKK